MKKVFTNSNYILDPHGAIGYLGLKKFQHQHPETNGVFFETAHPAKFKEIVEQTLGQKIEIPKTLQGFLQKEKTTFKTSADFTTFKKIVLSLSTTTKQSSA